MKTGRAGMGFLLGGWSRRAASFVGVAMKSPAEKKGRRGRCPAQACQLVKLACERWAAPAIRQGFFAKRRDLAQPSPGRPRLPLGRGGHCASGPLRPPPGVWLTLSRTRRPALRPVRAHRHEQDPEWGGVRNGWHEIGIKSRCRLSSSPAPRERRGPQRSWWR